MGKKKVVDTEADLYEEPTINWYDASPILCHSKKGAPEKSMESVAKQKKLLARGKELLGKLADTQASKSASADERWMQKIASSGTTSDKIAASLIMIKEHPLSCLKTLLALIAQTKKKGGKANIPIVENLREMFLDGLLPPNRPLEYFRNQPWYAKGVTDKHLLYWAFEEELKLGYASYVAGLEQTSKENIDFLRDVSIKTMATLLTQHSEQEKLLLSCLVNKIGDPIRKVASTTVTCLIGVLEEHPAMKLIIVREIELFMKRPNISEKAIYYSLIFLNQVILTAKEGSTSIKLTEIYFETFQRFMGDKSELVQTRILSAILTGLNRSYPFVSKEKQSEFEKEVDMFYRLAHSTTFSRATQSLILLYQVHNTGSVPDRFYRALYEKLLCPGFHCCSKISMFLNLVYRSVNADSNVSRVYAFIKRILQVSAGAKPALICGILFLVSEIIRNRPKLWTCVQQPEENITSSDQVRSDEDVKHNNNGEYDPFKRDPKYSNADESCLWELNSFCHHYHPSVKSFATSIVNGEFIQYKGDPLLDFGTIAFLDKFSFKNPRSNERLKGGSIMQSLRSRKVVKPLNSANFIDQDEEEVSEEHKFFHRYFQAKRAKQAQEDKKKDSSDTKVMTFDSDSDDDSDDGVSGGIDAIRSRMIADEEAALMGGSSSDDDGDAPEFDYDNMDAFAYDDEEDDMMLNDPTEEQLEQLLLQDEDMSDDSDQDGAPSAFAAAEEYAKLLEDDVDQKTIEDFRSKKKMKNKGKGKGNGNGKGKGNASAKNNNSSNLGKRKAPPKDVSRHYKKNAKKHKK